MRHAKLRHGTFGRRRAAGGECVGPTTRTERLWSKVVENTDRAATRRFGQARVALLLPRGGAARACRVSAVEAVGAWRLALIGLGSSRAKGLGSGLGATWLQFGSAQMAPMACEPAVGRFLIDKTSIAQDNSAS